MLTPVRFRGKWRLTDLVGEMLSRVTPEADCHPTRGVRVSISLSDRIGRSMWAGCYEEELVTFLRSMLEPGMVFVDVGAQMGYFSTIAAALVGESGAVHWFEPDPDCFSRLTRNSRAYPWVTIYNTAVADFSGETTFYRSPRLSESGWGTVFDDAAPRARPSVPVCTLDCWRTTRSIGRIDFLKMDVEGAEYRVLQGGRAAIEATRPMIWIEANEVCLSRDGKSVALLLGLLREWGYVPLGLQDPRSNLLATIVAIPKERSSLPREIGRSGLGLRQLAAHEI